MPFYLFAIELDDDQLTNAQQEEFRDRNPDGVAGKPFVVIRWFARTAKAEQVAAGNFGDLRRPANRGRSVLADHTTEKETKIEILRHARDLAENLRTQGFFVWHADDKTYSVYSLELKEEARDYRNFLEINGNRSHYKGYRYIGQTNKTIEERYKIHTGLTEDGNRFTAAATIAHKYAVGIDWDNCIDGGLTCLESLEKENEVGERLRSEGYATYFN